MNLLVTGIPKMVRPVQNMPVGNFKTRIRYREGKPAMLYLRAADGIQQFNIFDRGDRWELGDCVGCNSDEEICQPLPANLIQVNFKTGTKPNNPPPVAA